MATKLTRLTFVASDDIVCMLARMKREKYFACNQSEMIRDLMTLGAKAKAGEQDAEN